MSWNIRTDSSVDERYRHALDEMGWQPTRVVVARTPLQRLMGMISCEPEGIDALSMAFVMVFPRCSSVHTCFMRCALDIAFADARGSVLEVHERVPPWRLRSCSGADMVLERLSVGRVVTRRADIAGGMASAIQSRA